jgi:type I restriction enzyme S subunit
VRTHALKYLARLQYGDALATEERIETGEVPVFGSGGAHGRHDTANTAGPVIVVGRKGSIGALHWSERPVWVADTAYAIDQLLRPGSLRFVYYLLRASRLADLSQDVGVPGLSRDAVHRLPCPASSCERQRKTADFLDRECERIDVVDDVRRQLASLAMKSVADDLERLFAAGSTTRPVRLHHLLAARPCYGVLVPQLNEAGIPFVRVGDLERINAGQPTVQAAIPASQSAEYRRTVVAAGDVLVSVVGSIDRSTVVPPSLAGANVARAVARLQPKMIPASVLQAWTGTRAYAAQARNATSADTAQPTLNMRDLAVFTVHVPVELRAAERKVAALRARAHRIETTADALRACLTAYRSSLIHEAVTGKLDVTAASDRQMDERLHAAAENRLDEVPV